MGTGEEIDAQVALIPPAFAQSAWGYLETSNAFGGFPVSDYAKPLTADASAELVGLSRPAFYAAVRAGRLPAPVYPAPRAPRWFAAELLAALEKTRALPREQVAARRAAKLAKAAA